MGINQVLLTTNAISAETARLLSNILVFGKSANRNYDDDFQIAGRKTGGILNVRLPYRPRIRTGPLFDPNAVQEIYTPLTFQPQFGVDYSFSSVEMTLAIDDFSNRYLKPAAVTIASQIETAVYNQIVKTTGATVGTPGQALTPAQAADQVLFAAARLYENGVIPGDDKVTEVNSPQFNALLSSNNGRLFNPPAEISSIYRKGILGDYGGASHFVSNIVGRHFNGTWTGTPLVNGAGQSGSTLVTDGWGANSSLNEGDSFTIANVYATKPITHTSQDYLQSFTVLEKSVTAGGASTLTISPAIVGPGQQGQNVSALPADNAAITLLGTTGQSFSQAIMFHEDAVVLVAKDLELPSNKEASFVRDPDSGVGVRFIRDYDTRTDQFITRFDVLIGLGTLYPQLAVRIIGA